MLVFASIIAGNERLEEDFEWNEIYSIGLAVFHLIETCTRSGTEGSAFT